MTDSQSFTKSSLLSIKFNIKLPIKEGITLHKAENNNHLERR